MKQKLLRLFTIFLPAVSLACSAHYRQALEAYRLEEPLPFEQRTLDWIVESDRATSTSLPIQEPVQTTDLQTLERPEDGFLKVLVEVFDGEVEQLQGAIAALDAPEQLDARLAAPLRWEEFRVAVAYLNPGVRAARERWQATINQYNQATFLENLIGEFRTFTRYLNVETGEPLNKDMIQRFFPYPSTIALKGELIREQVRLAELEWQRILRDTVLEAGRAFFDEQYLVRAEATTRENIDLIKGLLGVLEERYRAGRASQPDLLKVQTELERQRNMLKDLQSRRSARVAELNALLDRTPASRMGAPEDSDLPHGDLSFKDLLEVALEKRQEINLQKTRVARTQIAIRMGEIMNRPLFSQGYSAFERGMMPEASEGASRESFGLRAKAVDRPDYAQAESYLAEMRKRLEAERSSLRLVEARTGGLARSILEELDVALREVELITNIVLPQDRSTYETTLSAYVSGDASFLDLLDAERQLIRSRLELHESRRVLNQTILSLATVRGTF